MRALCRRRSLAALFVLLSGADAALTCHLLRLGEGAVYEANGLAARVLAGFGPAGLVVFKSVSVLLVCVLMALVAARRPAAARPTATGGPSLPCSA